MCVRDGRSCLEMNLNEGAWCPECWDTHFEEVNEAARAAFKCTRPCEGCPDARCISEDWPDIITEEV